MERSSLSPGRLTARRFFRNRLAAVGLVILGALFLFSFLGGLISPYRQDQVFYRQELQHKEVAALRYNRELRFTPAPGQTLDVVARSTLSLAIRQGQTQVTALDVTYGIEVLGEDLYRITADGVEAGFAAVALTHGIADYGLSLAALTAYSNQESSFTFDGQDYQLDPQGELSSDGGVLGYLSPLILQSAQPMTAEFRSAVEQAISLEESEFSFNGRDFSLHYNPAADQWSVQEEVSTRVWDSYAAPSRLHPLGTDKNGMDVLTRLMYGGRVSLLIGFLVVLIAGSLGMLLGGVAGYFGGFVDELVMRLVDIFYCIPTTPLLIILGALMDGLRLDPRLRMVWLMLILGFLGWPSIARLVRGQILSLREQEFMVATEAVGLRPGRRIFRHLLPGVIPQLIVSCTMSLGSTILTEATLSFLGLGVKFPFASWGNIMNDVANVHVLTSYPFVWIPAGVCLVLAVLGFNFAGDGLRDAFDPKSKR